jgi:hypothetical protein
VDLFDQAARADLRRISQILGSVHGFDPDVARALATALAEIDTTPKSIFAADRAQSQLIECFRRHGHRGAAFLQVYHGITVAVIEALDAGRLTPRPFFERLAGRFAERHFDGVKAELGLDTTSDAARFMLWRPSFAYDNLPQANEPALATKPALAHFTVGMCCHINLDLAVSLDETIRELGYAGDARALEEIERGHNFVDTILAEKVNRSTELLAAEYDCPMSRRILAGGAVELVGAQSMATIRGWRAKTFPNAVQMSSAASDEERARIRLDVYRFGARKTVALFNWLPDLIHGVMSGTMWGGK